MPWVSVAAALDIAVRSSINTTVSGAQTNIARCFALQDIVDPSGDVGVPLPIRRLAGATGAAIR